MLSWVGRKEVNIQPPLPKKPRQKRRASEDAPNHISLEPLPVVEDTPPPLQADIVLVKPSQHSNFTPRSFCSEPKNLIHVELLMNISGKSAALAFKHYARGSPLSRVIVIHDSLSHKPLSIHPRIGGSANGHNGVTSVMSSLAAGPGFHRLRLGIGRPGGGGEYGGYVLERLDRNEMEHWGMAGEGVEKAWGVVENIILEELKKGKVVEVKSSK